MAALLLLTACAPSPIPTPTPTPTPKPPPPEAFPEIYEALGRVTVQTGNGLFSMLVHDDPITGGFHITVAEITPGGELKQRNFLVSGEFEELPDITPTAEPYNFEFQVFERSFAVTFRQDLTNPLGALFRIENTATKELSFITVIGYRGFPWIIVPIIVFILAEAGVAGYAIHKCVPVSIDGTFTDPLSRQVQSLLIKVHEL